MHKFNKFKLQVAELYESEARSELNMYQFLEEKPGHQKKQQKPRKPGGDFFFVIRPSFFTFLYYNDAVEFMPNLARSSSTDLSMISESPMVMEERIVKLEESTTWEVKIEERIATHWKRVVLRRRRV